MDTWNAARTLIESYIPDYLHWDELCWTFVVYLAELRILIHRNTRGMESWQIVCLTIAYTTGFYVGIYLFYKLTKWLFFHELGVQTRITQTGFKLLRCLPFVKEKIKRELASSSKVFASVFVLKPGEKYITSLPEKGMSKEKIADVLRNLGTSAELTAKTGMVSGAIYQLHPDLTKLFTLAFERSYYSNPLHPDLFPDVRKMEAEVVQMCINLFRGDENCCGSMTTGGTESILLACKAYRDFALETRGVTAPEIVAPASAHAAFDKACKYFKIKLVHTPLGPDYCADVKAMRRRISRNTIMVVASAPNFPYGTMDPIQEIAKFTKLRGIGLHVDCCLGGFVLPFMRLGKYELPPFDFDVDGVTSISADMHKYGFTPKGSSVVLFRSKELRSYQFCTSTDWTGGIYASATIQGSRAGVSVVTAWVAMMYHGVQGYSDIIHRIVDARIHLEAQLRKFKEIFVMGQPKTTVVAVCSKVFDITRLSTILTDKGWHINVLQNPLAFHLCLTALHLKPGVLDQFVNDIKSGITTIMMDPHKKASGVGAMYGMAQSIPDRSLIEDLSNIYLNHYYQTS